MRSSPLNNIDSEYDVLIVGGGIVGAGIFRDLCLHGVNCLLVDKKDFSSQTSSASSKMLHGGIRYMENLDFKLVWEALHEKNLWLKLAPHLCYEASFYLPVYKDSKRPLWMIKAGLHLYDFLSSFQNSPASSASVKQTLKALPGLKKKGLKGSGIYYDAVMDDAKLTLEVIFDAIYEEHCEALNYTEVLDVKKEDDYLIADLRDTISGETKTCRFKDVVFATGPFTDKIMHNISAVDKWENHLLPSKGSHLWLRHEDLPISHPMVLTPEDGRVIFVIPQNNKVLVGTTETQVTEDFFDIKASQEEIEYLLKNLKDFFPDSQIDETKILSTFAGIRPLVKEDDKSSLGKTAREHKIFRPLSNLYVILGGKYTTFRVMGQDISREICHKHQLCYSSDLTKRKLRHHCLVPSFKDTPLSKELVMEVAAKEHVRTFDDLLKRRIGIQNKKYWKQSESFEAFFESLRPQLENYIKVTSDDIANF